MALWYHPSRPAWLPHPASALHCGEGARGPERLTERKIWGNLSGSGRRPHMLLALRQPPERLSLGLKFSGCVPVAPQRQADSDSENSESDFARLRLPSVGLRSGSHGFAAETLVMPLHWPPLDLPWQLRYPPWLPRVLPCLPWLHTVRCHGHLMMCCSLRQCSFGSMV